MIKKLEITSSGPGLHMISEEVNQIVRDSGINNGICNMMIQHCSASLLIQENADPSARHDLENWLKRLVPEHDPLYTHIFEGPDDMPSHIKSALTPSSLSIPIHNGQLALGTWQGIYLWEHRKRGQVRNIILHLGE